MNKRVFIIHGWDFTPSMNWYSWLKQELVNRGYEVHVPEMPDTEEPQIDKWVNHLKKTIGKVDENTYLVGHSIGVQTILRYLNTLESDSKIGGAVFVAGWHALTGLESQEEKDIAAPWLQDNIDTDKIKNILDKSIALFSSNDEFVPIENIQWFEDTFSCKTQVIENQGHFDEESGVTSSSETLNAVLNICNFKRIRAVAIVIRDGQILLMHRIKHGKEYYVLPGGGVEKDETYEQAVIREVYEEASLEIEIEKLLYHHIYDDNTEQYFYLCRYVSGEPKLGEANEAEAMRESDDNFYKPLWFNIKDLNKLLLYPLEIRDWFIEDLKSDFTNTPKEAQIKIINLRQAI